MFPFPHDFDTVKAVWRKFVSNTHTDEDIEKIEPDIFASWVRSRQNSVDPLQAKSDRLSEKELSKRLSDNELLIVVAHSYMSKLYSFLEEEHFSFILSAADGYILDMVGGTGKQMHESKLNSSMRVGVRRDEAYAGTNGVGTALFLDRPIQIFGAEHYVEMHHEYTSSAAPIHDADGNIIGCFNMVGPRDAHSKHSLGMIVAAVDGVEKELRLRVANDRLFLLNAQLESTLQSMPSAVITLDEQGCIISSNRNAARLLKVPSVALKGVLLDKVMRVESPGLDLMQLGEDIHDRDITVSTENNKAIYLSMTASLLFGQDGRRAGVVLLFNSTKHVNRIVNQRSGSIARYTFDSIVGNSPKIAEVVKIGRIAAQQASNVLILGESGTGKELVAQAIHNASNRASGPFIAINCGSLPRGLIDSELFGYEGGAFTGASREGRPGKFELADQGTIFLDEIGDMPLDIQVSLLRVLQLREVTRIGGKTAKQVDVRIIAATNRDLEESILEKTFRVDLYYRLNVFPIPVPPLREHLSDVPDLVRHFITESAAAANSSVTSISDEALDILTRYDWPGNVRELQNVIERASNMAACDTITVVDIPSSVNSSSLRILPEQNEVPIRQAPRASTSVVIRAQVHRLKEGERECILQTLEHTAGNISRAARMLGISRKTLYSKMEAYSIDCLQFRSL